MDNIKDFRTSGVLELYSMGIASPEEILAVERMAVLHPEIRQELDALSLAMESYALAHAVAPRSVVKPLLLATIDYAERLTNGESPETPPLLTAQSKPQDFATWVNRPDMVLPADADTIHARIINHNPEATTAIIWVTEQTDYEVHEYELERFLILEGTCNILLASEVHPLSAGDFFAIPLSTPHKLQVTSVVPCKAILQRLPIAVLSS